MSRSAARISRPGRRLMKTILAPGLKSRMLGLGRLVLDQHPRQPRRRSARRSGKFQNQGRIKTFRARTHSAARSLSRTFTKVFRTSSASIIIRRAATTKKAGTTSTFSAGSATRCRSRSISSAAIRFSPRRSCSTSRCLWIWRSAAGMKRHPGMAFVLFQSAADCPGLYPEHDIFIQLMKLKNTLRHMKGEELITHLGLEYYD